MLGVLMLDTRFPRVPGDIGNPATFAMLGHRVLYRTVPGASPQRVVRERDPQLLQPFIDAAHALVHDGATAVSTSCGFLVLFQHALQAALPVPVWTSSLLLLAELQGNGTPGVLTVDAASLTTDHLRAAGAARGLPNELPVEGLADGCAFQRCLLNDEPVLDTAQAERATVDAALRLVGRRPDVTDIVLECTNMPPYAHAVRAATGRRVHDITTLLASRFVPAAITGTPSP